MSLSISISSKTESFNQVIAQGFNFWKELEVYMLFLFAVSCYSTFTSFPF